jgi:hypothetical protein
MVTVAKPSFKTALGCNLNGFESSGCKTDGFIVGGVD